VDGRPIENVVRTPSSPRRRVLLASIVVLVVGGGIGAAMYTSTADQQSGGDPGGKVLRRLETIRSAVPSGALGISVVPIAATWMGACASDSNSHAGWVEDRVTVGFTDTAPAAMVKATIDSGLRSLGWVRHDIVITSGQGPTAHWSRAVRGGRRADAFAFPVPSGSSNWFLTATWQPPGPVVFTGGCA
jgi:hypothetical protein